MRKSNRVRRWNRGTRGVSRTGIKQDVLLASVAPAAAAVRRMKSRRERRRLLIKKPPDIRIDGTDHRGVILIFTGTKSKKEKPGFPSRSNKLEKDPSPGLLRRAPFPVGEGRNFGSGAVWFFLAAVNDRRLLIQSLPALIERRYSKLHHYRNFGFLPPGNVMPPESCVRPHPTRPGIC